MRAVAPPAARQLRPGHLQVVERPKSARFGTVTAGLKDRPIAEPPAHRPVLNHPRDLGRQGCWIGRIGQKPGVPDDLQRRRSIARDDRGPAAHRFEQRLAQSLEQPRMNEHRRMLEQDLQGRLGAGDGRREALRVVDIRNAPARAIEDDPLITLPDRLRQRGESLEEALDVPLSGMAGIDQHVSTPDTQRGERPTRGQGHRQ